MTGNSPAVTTTGGSAAQLGLGMRQSAGELSKPWRRRNHALELGVGIAIGHAACGQIGFEGRLEYTAIGTVTNLAADLSSFHVIAQEAQLLANAD